MKNHMRSCATLAAFALVGSSTAAADTHLGQPASDSVTLEAVTTIPVCPANFFPLSFDRNMPDGSSVDPFVIPCEEGPRRNGYGLAMERWGTWYEANTPPACRKYDHGRFPPGF